MENLTKDGKKLICTIYKDYLIKRACGKPKAAANYFASSESINNNLLPEWSLSDVDETARELARNNYIQCVWADDIAHNIHITDKGIIYMENRFKKGLAEIINYLSALA